MKITAKGMSLGYLFMGIIFISIAILTVGDTVWKPITIILAFIATLQFGGCIKLATIHFKAKRKKKK